MAINKLANLTENDVWIFTKQSVSFDTAFKSAKLLSEIPDKDNVNIEYYFTNNYERYGINATHRHRVLVFAQLYGLITKNPLYARGGNYAKEQATEIFEMLDTCVLGSQEYNKIKSEQILKVKIRAIIDTANNNEKWCVLPVIFSYKVLKALKDQYGINDVTLDLFYTYVMTCSDYGEVGEAVEYIKNDAAVSNYLAKYKDRSRFIPLISKNIKLFNVTRDRISINKKFDEYFNHQFIERFDIDELNIQLARDIDYTYFVTTYQGFDVNLIDEDANRPENYISPHTPKIRKKKIVETENGVIEDDDGDYVTRVDDVKEYNINVDIAKDVYKNKPTTAISGVLKRYSKNPLIGKVAIKKADYKCENSTDHTTFISSHTKKQFMEAHHIIPINRQDDIWDKYGANIDCEENIVSLCPNCHRAIHYAVKEVKREIVTKLYSAQKAELNKIGVEMTLDDLLGIYGV